MVSGDDGLFQVTEADRQLVEPQLLEQQRKVDFDTKEFTVEILVHKLDENDFTIPPYQRNLVWNTEKQSKFIESVLLGLPIPFMFGYDDPSTGRIEIVDGAQRLRTLQAFLHDTLQLVLLEKLTFVTGFRFSELPASHQRRFRNRTLRMVVLSEHTDLDTRFDLFERINTGSTRLEPAELRKGAFPGAFMSFVQDCARDSLFVALCPVGAAHKRAEHEELVLRFFAYAERYRDFQHDVAHFLNQYLRDKNDGFDRAEKLEGFQSMLRFVERNFPHGFRKAARARTTPRVRFEALSVGSHLALGVRPDLVPDDVSWLESPEFLTQVTTHASNSGPRLRARIEFVRDRLLGVGQ